MSIRVLVIGDGKMGRAVAEVAVARGCDVVGVFGPTEMAAGLKPGMADVAIEFTEPGAAATNARACVAVKLALVSGTTGWDGEMDAIRDAVKSADSAFLHSPNFSVGVHLFRKIVETAASNSKLGDLVSGLAMIETHHTAKKDAPSGTAKMLAAVAEKASGRAIPVTSVRVGSVPGTHELIIDAPFEQIRLVHEARDRKVFADGAVAAAKWLVGKKGVFSFDDFVNSL